MIEYFMEMQSPARDKVSQTFHGRDALFLFLNFFFDQFNPLHNDVCLIQVKYIRAILQSRRLFLGKPDAYANCARIFNLWSACSAHSFHLTFCLYILY